MRRTLTNSEIERMAEVYHRRPRAEYDTPASVRGCPCPSCNKARKIHGKPTIPKRVNEKFRIENLDFVSPLFNTPERAQKYIDEMNFPNGREEVASEFYYSDYNHA